MSGTDPTRSQPFHPMPMAQRMEFIRAFVEQSWARPGTDRPVAKVHIALMATMGVVVAAGLTGVILQLLHPIALPPAAAAQPARSSAGPQYAAITGWDCAPAADHGFEATGRGADWHTIARGGWAQDGCHGTFEAVPMSGHAQTYDQSQSAIWWFTPGAGITRCDIAVYLPDGDQPADSAATAARFFVTAGRNGAPFASFVVDQTNQRGAWHPVGTYPVSQSGIAVKLVNQGVPASTGARLAVTQVRIVCTG